MKKLLLGLGTIAAVVAPVAAVVACGTSDAKPTNPNPTDTGPGKTRPTNARPANTGNPVVPGTNKGVVDHKDVTAKNVLTDSDKELASTLYEDQLTDFTSSNTFKHGLDAIADIETDYGVQFSDNSKKILAPDTHVTYNDQYDASKKELKITMFSDTNPAGGEEFVFHITFKQVQGIETTLSQTELDKLLESDFYSISSASDIDDKLGTKLNQGKYKDYDYFNFIVSSKIIELHKGDPLSIRFKLLPKTVVASTATKTGLDFPVADGQYILDVEDSPTLSRTDLKSAFNKFSKDIDFNAATDMASKFSGINKDSKIDKTKKYTKVMLVGNHEHQNQLKYFCGVMGYGKVSGELIFIWRQFDKADISDNSPKGTTLVFKMNPSGSLDDVPGTVLMALDSSVHRTVFNYLTEIAKKDFPGEKTSLI